MKIYNVTIPKKYTKNGEEKTAWNTVGKLIEWDATEGKEKGFTLELHMFPETSFKVFPQEDKVEKKPEISEHDKAEQEAYAKDHPTSDYPETPKPEDIPF